MGGGKDGVGGKHLGTIVYVLELVCQILCFKDNLVKHISMPGDFRIITTSLPSEEISAITENCQPEHYQQLSIPEKVLQDTGARSQEARNRH